MKSLLFCFVIIWVFACGGEKAAKDLERQSNLTSKQLDTVIVSQKRNLDANYDTGFLNKSHWFYWTVGRDTLDFKLLINEYSRDSLVGLGILHRKPIAFSHVLEKIENCFEVIKNDYRLEKLSSFYFEHPLLYPDLVKSLSNEYEKEFGVKNVSYERLNKFLLKSELSSQLNDLMAPFGKVVSRYSIEKFHLIHKENYSFELPDTDFSNYPDFAIHGMGISVYL